MLKKTIIIIGITAIVMTGLWLRENYFSDTKPLTQTQFLMDTIIEITAYGKNAETAETAAFAEIKRLHKVFDRFDKDSEVSLVNASAGVAPVRVSKDILMCIERANELSEKLENVFDVSIGPLSALWGIGRKGDFVPSGAQIKEMLPLVNYKNIVVDEKEQTVFLKYKNMQLDFGGVAKGYACDRAIAVMKTAGITSALVNAGGDVRVIGRREGGKPWNIGVQDPRKPDGMIATLELERWDTMETSGDYQRYIEVGGNRYSHILDPRSGYQPREVAAVTIVGDSSLDDDVFSTALFILGVEKGKQLLKQFPGTEAIFTTTDGRTILTDGLLGKVKLSAETANGR